MKQFYLIAGSLLIGLFIAGCVTSSGHYFVPKEQFYRQTKKIAIMSCINKVDMLKNENLQGYLIKTDREIYNKLKEDKRFVVIAPETTAMIKKQIMKEMNILRWSDGDGVVLDSAQQVAINQLLGKRIGADCFLFSSYTWKNIDAKGGRVSWDGASQKVPSWTIKRMAVSLILEIKNQDNELLWLGRGGVAVREDIIKDNRYTANVKTTDFSTNPVNIFEHRGKDRIKQAIDIAFNSIIKQ
jgi:hypothetical protein